MPLSVSAFLRSLVTATAAATLSSSALLAQSASNIGSPAAASSRKVLTPDTYDSWRSIVAPVLSRDGRWAGFTVTPAAGDGEAVLRATAGATEYRIPRGFTGRPMLTTTGTPFRAPAISFAADGHRAAFLAYAPRTAFDSARRARKKTPPQPRLVVVDLANGANVITERVSAFTLPREDGRWIVYSVAKDSSADSTARDTTAPRVAASPGGAPHPVAAPGSRSGNRKLETGAPLVVRDLASGTETRIENVGGYVVDPRGSWVAYAVAASPDSGNGVFLRTLATGKTVTVLQGSGRYKGLATDSTGHQLAFVSDHDDAASRHPAFSLYHVNVANPVARRIVAAGALGRDTLISPDSISFQHDGVLLSFGVAPQVPDSISADSLADKSVYDLWNYNESRLQPEQKLKASADRKRAFLTVYRVADGRTVRIGNDSTPGGKIGRGGKYALLQDESAYSISDMWGEGAVDAMVVDLTTGRKHVVAHKLEFPPSLSDAGRYVVWFDSGGWFAHSITSGKTVRVNDRLKRVRFDQETWDTPSPAAPWGLAGWTRGDARMLVYDRFDIWSLDPSGATAPVLLTDSLGARNHVVLRLVRPRRDQEEVPLDADAQVVLSGTNDDTKASGFYRTRVGARHAPEQLVMADALYGAPQLADNGSEYLVTRETVSEFPNLYVGPSLGTLQRISDVNPQQAQYRWPTVELVHWTNVDQVPLRGLLYKPDGFDPARKYPMIVYYYEQLSENLNKYPVPSGRNVVNPSVYTSRGYLVFFPDIAYTTGYPGMSAVKSIVPGVKALVARGFVKADAIGCAGQSWGGYQGAFMVTQTTLFKACFVGAPVANMTSAYGGVRWESGRSRQAQYEHTQSRIGGSLWAYRDRYIENSPLFYADRIQTPLLIMSNDGDGAVPWYQGIEFFSALKRLRKEAYLVDYNGDAHNPVKDANKKDIDRKMLQFFAHHLQGEPAPEWMTRGIPFLNKGRDQLAPASVETGEPGTSPTAPGGARPVGQ